MAMALTALAIDDEPHALDIIGLHAAKVPFLDLKARFTDAYEGIAWLQSNPVDLLFLDIQMPDISGIELLHCLARPPLVVFTTAYAEYAVQGFELDAVDYLLKPFSPARFLKACTKAFDLHAFRIGNAPDHLFVRTGFDDEKVCFDDLLYIEADGNYLTLVLPTRRLLTRQTLADLMQQLPPDRFVRVHRSFGVAVDKITRLGRQDMTIAASHLIPIGASYEEAVARLRARL